MRTGSLSILLLFTLFLSVSIKITGQINDLLWAKTYGGERVDAHIQTQTDFTGNNYVFINSNSDLLYTSDGQALNINRGSKIIKYTTNGNFIWEIQLPIDLILEGFESQGYAVNPDGTFFVLSKWTDALDMPVIDFGNNIIVDNTELYTDQTTNSASIIVKYSASGQALWAKSFENKTITPETIKTASDFGFYLGGKNGGFSSDPTNFGNGVTLGANDLFGDVFIARFSSDGDARWANSFGTENIDFLHDLEPDAQGNLFFSRAPFIPQAFGTITKLDGNGDVLWSKGVSSLSNTNLSFRSFNTSNNLILTGELGAEDLFVDGIEEPILTTSAKDVPYFAVFNAEDGGYQNGIVLDTLDHSDFFLPARFQESENIIIIGGSYFFNESNRIEEITISKEITLFENENQQATAIHYLAAFSFQGKALWAKKIATDGYINLKNITFDANGSIITSGIYDINGEYIYQSQAGPNGRREAALQFANGLMPEHRGDKDLFIAKFGEDLPVISDVDFTLTHYHNIEKNDFFQPSEFQEPTMLKRIEPGEDNSFKVCADGSRSSFFNIDMFSIIGNYQAQDIEIKILEDESEDVDTYGQFQDLVVQSNTVLSCRYLHPNHIEFPDGEKVVEYTIQVSILNTNIKEEFSLLVYPAPVLMVHGFLSSSKAFAELEVDLIENRKYPPELLHKANYSKSSYKSFLTLINDEKVLRNNIDILISNAVTADFATGKVDVVAHSMGGLLTRFYLKKNYYRADIHKMISCNTPHFGTQLANLAMETSDILRQLCGIAAESNVAGQAVCIQLGITIDSPHAIRDLQIWQDNATNAIKSLFEDKHDIPTHFISSAETILNYVESPIEERTLLELLLQIGADYVLANLYDDRHDFVVPLRSQALEVQEFIDKTHQTLIENQIHMGSVSANSFKPAIHTILEKDSKSDFFLSEINPLSFPPLQFSLNNFPNVETTSSPEESINIDVVETVHPGDTIFIEVNGGNDVKRLRVTLFELETNMRKSTDSNYLRFEYVVPEYPLGKRAVSAYGYDENGKWIGNSLVYFTVIPNRSPDIIKYDIYNRPLIVKQGSTVETTPSAFYGDYEVDLSELPNVDYSFQSEFAKHIGEGIIRGEVVGRDTLIIRYKNVNSAPIKVIVIPKDTSGVVTGIEDKFVKIEDRSPELKLFPNPTSDVLNVEILSSATENVEITIFDLTGKRILANQVSISPKLNTYSIQTNNLTKGMYFIRLKSKYGILSKQFVKL